MDARTTPISLETFKTITNSNGEFTTWTDIVMEAMDELTYNPELFVTPIKSFSEVIGDNIMFKNISNKNILPFNDNLTLNNNTMTQDKWNMLLYSDFMGPMEFSTMDRKSAYDWSQILSESLASIAIARRDFGNAECLKQVTDVALAIGNVFIMPDIDKEAPYNPTIAQVDYTSYKNAMVIVERFFQNIDRQRTKYAKGFDRKVGGTLISPQVALNFLAGKTAGFAGDDAYRAAVKENQVYEYLGAGYTKSLYLGQDYLMSEFLNGSTKVNSGLNTGNLIYPFFFSDLHIQFTYTPSVAFYGHSLGAEWRDVGTSRTKTVFTDIWRMNAAVKPVYGRFNYSFYSKIPVFPSWTDINGVVHRSLDLSVAADYNEFRNDVYKRQPMMYNAWLDGASNLTQDQVDALWTAATITWDPKTVATGEVLSTGDGSTKNIINVQRALVEGPTGASWVKLLGEDTRAAKKQEKKANKAIKENEAKVEEEIK